MILNASSAGRSWSGLLDRFGIPPAYGSDAGVNGSHGFKLAQYLEPTLTNSAGTPKPTPHRDLTVGGCGSCNTAPANCMAVVELGPGRQGGRSRPGRRPPGGEALTGPGTPMGTMDWSLRSPAPGSPLPLITGDPGRGLRSLALTRRCRDETSFRHRDPVAWPNGLACFGRHRQVRPRLW